MTGPNSRTVTTGAATTVVEVWDTVPADDSDIARVSDPLRPTAATADAFKTALTAARAYDAGDRPTVGTYTADRLAHIVKALADAGLLTTP